MNTNKNNTQLPQSSVSVSVTDVRVGNLILNDFGEIQPIYSVDEKSILTKVEENGWSICFKPKTIPLTKEWFYKIESEIIKAGFSYSYYEIGNRLMIYLENDITIDCRSVHKIQNVYFYITGSELHIGSLTEH